MHQNSKDHILSISDLKLRRSFQATVSNSKKNIDTDQTLEITGRQTVQLKTVYPMNKNDISADNFIPVMELQDANGCSDTSVFLEETRKCFRDFLEFVTVLTLGLPLFPLGPSTFG